MSDSPLPSAPGEQISTASVPTPRAERFALAGAVASLTGILLGMLRSKLVAMTVGSEGVGIVAETSQLVSLLNVASAVFGGAALLAWVSQGFRSGDTERVERGLGSALGATGATGIVAGLVAFGVAPFVLPAAWGADARGYVALAALAQVFTLLQSVFNHVHIGRSDLRATTLSAILSTLAATVVSIAFVLTWGLDGQFYSLVVGGALSLVITAGFLVSRRDPVVRIRLAYDPAFVRYALTAGTVMLVSGYGAQALLSVARFTLEHLGEGTLGAEYNGHFQAAWMIGSTYFGLVLGGIGNFFYPRFAAATDADALTAEIEQAATMALRYTPPLAIGAIAMRDIAMYVLYSGEFDLAGEMLGYLLAGDIARSIAWAYLAPLPMRGRVRALLLVEGANVALGVVLVIAGGWVGGPRGVAVGFLALSCLMAPITAWVTRLSCGVNIGWRRISHAVLFAISGSALNAFLDVHVLVRLAGLAVALVLVWRSGVLSMIAKRLGLQPQQ